jgi:hypothetical protein
MEGGSEGFWMSHATPRESVMMQVNGLGAFVRALVPIQLTGGYTVTFGAWVGVSPDDLARAFGVWLEPSYAQLELDGVLANELPPWKVLASPVRLMVRNIDQTPYCDSSSDPELANVLADVWPHELVLSANSV